MFTVRITETHKHVNRTKCKAFIVEPGGTHTNHYALSNPAVHMLTTCIYGVNSFAFCDCE